MPLNLEATFKKFKGDYAEFVRLPKQYRRHPCADVNAFILLNEWAPVPKGRCMIWSVGNDDLIYLKTPCSQLAQVATESDIQALVMCGVGYDEQEGFLYLLKI